MDFNLIGSPCGEHGPYTFYKGFRYTKNGKTGILALSEFFFVKLWPDSDLISIGELQLLWEDKNTQQTLASLRLYILPESTPDGRNDIHGQDEVLAITEKVVIKVEDLLTWIVTSSNWHWGTEAMWAEGGPPPEASPPPDIKPDPDALDQAATTVNVSRHSRPCPKYIIDMADIDKEKNKLDKSHWETTLGVVVLSYARYCRYRGLMKRLEGAYNDWLRSTIVAALGGFNMPFRTTRVLFCKETFDYPELEGHELLCNHLAPKIKGRVKKKRKRANNSSEDSATESESSQSTSSSGNKPKATVGSAKPRLRCTLEVVPATSAGGGEPVRTVPIQVPARSLPPEMDERRFLSSLHSFMRSRSTPIGRVPVVGFKEVNLFKLYKKVAELGGYENVTAGKLWKHVYEVTGGDITCTSAATLSRRHYEKLLLPYERFLRSSSLGRSKPPMPHPVMLPSTVLSSPHLAKMGLAANRALALRGMMGKREKENSAPAKLTPTTVAQPPSVTIIKKDGCKEEVVDFASADAKFLQSGRSATPVIKKQKLEMLKEGGLEVTPIGSTAGAGGAAAPTQEPTKETKAPPHQCKDSASDSNQVSITVTPDMSHLMHPSWSGNNSQPRGSSSVPRELSGGALDLSTKPLALGSNLEISLVPARRPAPSHPSHMPSHHAQIPIHHHPAAIRYAAVSQVYGGMKPGSGYSVEQAYLNGLVAAGRVLRPPLPRPPPPAQVSLYKDLLRSHGMFSLFPDGSTSISLVGNAKTPTSK